MKLNTTYGEIFAMFHQNGPITALREAKMPITMSLELRKTVRALQPYYDDVLEEQNKLVTELGENGVIKFGGPSYAEFEQRIKEIMDQPAEVDITLVDVNTLIAAGVQLSEYELEILQPILNLEEGDAT